MQVWGDSGNINIYNIYNNCQHDATLEALDAHLHACRGAGGQNAGSCMLWCGDLNRHHLLWDEDWNCHLFIASALQAVDRLLEKIADHNMIMVLPKDIPTLEAKSTKNWTQPDNIFCSTDMEELIVLCDTDPQR